MPEAPRAGSRVFEMHWHREVANDLLECGLRNPKEMQKFQKYADERMRLADIIQQELKENELCKECGKPLRDIESVETGYGPDCRKKLRRVG